MRDWIAHDYDESDCDWLYYAVTHEIPQVFAILQPYVECQTQVPNRDCFLGSDCCPQRSLLRFPSTFPYHFVFG